MVQWPGARILRRQELDAFLAQALSPKLYEPDQLQELKVTGGPCPRLVTSCSGVVLPGPPHQQPLSALGWRPDDGDTGAFGVKGTPFPVRVGQPVLVR